LLSPAASANRKIATDQGNDKPGGVSPDVSRIACYDMLIGKDFVSKLLFFSRI
jgi:hypothetical protein